MKQKVPVVVVDLRNKNEAQKSHIKGAVSIPAAQLASAKAKFPKIKSAPVVLYANDRNTAAAAFKTVRGWGYKNTSMLEGNFQGWVQAKGPVAQNSLGTKIVYIPKPVPGQISVKQFKAIATKLPSDVFLLDARDLDETKSGMLKGAINIPTQDIAKRLSEIPKNKKVVIHCKTGTRAAMAYETLKENGYKAEFLKAKITISKDGSFKISS